MGTICVFVYFQNMTLLNSPNEEAMRLKSRSGSEEAVSTNSLSFYVVSAVSIGNDVSSYEINDSKMRTKCLRNEMMAAITKTTQELSWMKASVVTLFHFNWWLAKTIFEYGFRYFPWMMHAELIHYDRLLDFLSLLSPHHIITVVSCGFFFNNKQYSKSKNRRSVMMI